jgi:hypothetical protein
VRQDEPSKGFHDACRAFKLWASLATRFAMRPPHQLLGVSQNSKTQPRQRDSILSLKHEVADGGMDLAAVRVESRRGRRLAGASQVWLGG